MNVQEEPVSVYSPVALEEAVGGEVTRLHPGQVADGVGANDGVFEAGAGRVRAEAGEGAVEPGADVTEHDVVARIGAVPAFPEGGRTLGNSVAPTGDAGLCGDAVSQVGAPGLAEGMQEVLGAQDAAVEVIVMLAYPRAGVGRPPSASIQVPPVLGRARNFPRSGYPLHTDRSRDRRSGG